MPSSGCKCQREGKAGAPYPTGRCMLCWEFISRDLPYYGSHFDHVGAQFCGCDPAENYKCAEHRQPIGQRERTEV